MKSLWLGLFLMALAACQPLPATAPTATAAPAPSATPAPESSATPAPGPGSLYRWPVRALTEAQIAEVRDCAVEAQGEERYGTLGEDEEPAAAYTPENACDWAVLAHFLAKSAFEAGVEGVVPDAAEAYAEAVVRNYGYAFQDDLYYNITYGGAVTIVEPPPALRQPITSLTLDYAWGGMGEAVGYRVEITQADQSPVVRVTGAQPPLDSPPTTVEPAPVQAFADALVNLLPVAEPGADIVPCTDNYPTWEGEITFQDGQRVVLRSGSNLYQSSGPFTVEVDGERYVEAGIAISRTLWLLITALELPLGEPGAMVCGGAPVLDAYFPPDG